MAQKHDVEVLRVRLNDYLKGRGLRRTSERFMILEKAVEQPSHFGVDDLYNAMERDGYHVSRATVYNTLELLCEAMLLNRHLFGTNQALYEVAAGSHVHLCCRHCGAIREVVSPLVTDSLLNGDYDGFSPQYSSSIVYGLCTDCRKKNDG